ncbi:amidohydrolase family protein [Porticoccaceae bacterium]|nr:amidohydrolase family protein [Porticoccaceae bacterium]
MCFIFKRWLKISNLSVVITFFIATIFFLSGCTGTKVSSSVKMPPVTAFVGATLIDGVGTQPVLNAVVLVQGEKIYKVGTKANVEIPKHATVIDVSGKWIVPGLVDSHVHFMESGRIYTKPHSYDLTHLVPYEQEVEWAKNRVPITLQSYLCAGVTSAISVGGPKFEFDVRDRAKTMLNAPNVFVAGKILNTVSNDLAPLFDGHQSTYRVTDAESVIAGIKQNKDLGADLIKTLYISESSKLDSDVHKHIISEAHRMGVKVTTHGLDIEAGRTLINLGVDSLQHVALDAIYDDAFIALAKRTDTVIVPTLAVWPRSMVEPPGKSYKLLDIEKRCGDPEVIKSWYEVDNVPSLTPDFLSKLAVQISIMNKSVQRLNEAGVPLAAGSDAGNPGLVHGASLHYELKLMGEQGIAPMDLIKAATLNSARVAGKEDLVGSIEPGKLADLLILTADPLSDISNLQAIDAVIKSGNIFSQSELLL